MKREIPQFLCKALGCSFQSVIECTNEASFTVCKIQSDSFQLANSQSSVTESSTLPSSEAQDDCAISGWPEQTLKHSHTDKAGSPTPTPTLAPTGESCPQVAAGRALLNVDPCRHSLLTRVANGEIYHQCNVLNDKCIKIKEQCNILIVKTP